MRTLVFALALAAPCAALTMSGAALARPRVCPRCAAPHASWEQAAASPVLAPAFTIAKSGADEALDSLLSLFPAIFLVRRSAQSVIPTAVC